MQRKAHGVEEETTLQTSTIFLLSFGKKEKLRSWFNESLAKRCDKLLSQMWRTCSGLGAFGRHVPSFCLFSTRSQARERGTIRVRFTHSANAKTQAFVHLLVHF
jgi:hypothetical protein